MVDPIIERATNNFTVKVYPTGRLYIACDPIDRNLAIAGDGMFGFDLPEGIKSEHAAETARFKSEHLVCMSYTFF